MRYFLQKNPSSVVLIVFHSVAMLLDFALPFPWLLSTANILQYGAHEGGKRDLTCCYRQYGLALAKNPFLLNIPYKSLRSGL